jgi:hypothetical protein
MVSTSRCTCMSTSPVLGGRLSPLIPSGYVRRCERAPGHRSSPRRCSPAHPQRSYSESHRDDAVVTGPAATPSGRSWVRLPKIRPVFVGVSASALKRCDFEWKRQDSGWLHGGATAGTVPCLGTGVQSAVRWAAAGLGRCSFPSEPGRCASPPVAPPGLARSR